MQARVKVALDAKTISHMMGMEVEEVRLWQNLSEMRSIILDYNFGSQLDAVKKRLDALTEKCKASGLYDFAIGVEHAKAALIY